MLVDLSMSLCVVSQTGTCLPKIGQDAQQYISNSESASLPVSGTVSGTDHHE